MQTKFSDGSAQIAGTVTSVKELRHVGDKNTAKMEFSVAVGKNRDTTTIYANVKAWRHLAHYAANIEKGDSVHAIGRLESREYNGKTYTDLVCDWLDIKPKSVQTHALAAVLRESAPEQTSFDEIDDDGDLPF